MPTFRYKAYSTHGIVTAGTIDAKNADAAVDALYSAGLTPFETREQSPNSFYAVGASRQATQNVTVWKRELFGSARFGLKELTGFTVELASLASAGLPIDAALRVMAGPGAASGRKQVTQALLKEVLAGAQLSEAMGRHPNIFPLDYRAVLAAGEAGGITGQVLQQIADLLSRRLEIHGKIVSALLYPIILIAMSLVSVLVIIFVLVPSISPIFIDAGLPLPGILGTLVELQDNWVGAVLGLGVAGMAAAATWRRLRQNAQVMHELDRLKSRLPVIGALIRLREAGRFMRALGTLIGAGVPLMSSMKTAGTLVINRYLSTLYGEAINRVPQGTHLSRAFEGSDLLSPASLRLIAVGEEGGQLASMLLRIASGNEAELQQKVERLVGLLTPMLTMLVGGSIGLLIMQVMAAVLSINNLAFQ